MSATSGLRPKVTGESYGKTWGITLQANDKGKCKDSEAEKTLASLKQRNEVNVGTERSERELKAAGAGRIRLRQGVHTLSVLESY